MIRSFIKLIAFAEKFLLLQAYLLHNKLMDGGPKAIQKSEVLL